MPGVKQPWFGRVDLDPQAVSFAFEDMNCVACTAPKSAGCHRIRRCPTASRQPLSFRGELGDNLPARGAAIPQLIDAADGRADPFVGGELNVAVVVAVKADGELSRSSPGRALFSRPPRSRERIR